MAGIGNNRQVGRPQGIGNRRRPAGVAGVGQNRPVYGRQLQRRLSEGVITKDQAAKTVRQRDLLKTAFGPNWRQVVYGENVQALRTGLAGGNLSEEKKAQYEAAYKTSLARRKQMLERAKKKLS